MDPGFGNASNPWLAREGRIIAYGIVSCLVALAVVLGVAVVALGG